MIVIRERLYAYPVYYFILILSNFRIIFPGVSRLIHADELPEGPTDVTKL
jgi:hypothetical protein